MSGVQSTFSCKDPRTTGGHQRTRRVVSGPCQPRGRQGTGKRMVVLTEVGLGRKMGATSIGIESTKSKRCLSSLSVSVPSRSPPVAPVYTRVKAPEVPLSMSFPVASPGGTEKGQNKARLT